MYKIEVIEASNSSEYGLGCNVFTENISRGLRVAHQLEAGSAWVRGCFLSSCDVRIVHSLSLQVNCAQAIEPGVPFGGYKQSGSGRELGQYALDT